MCLNNYVLYSNPLEITDSNDSKKIKHYFFENKVLYSFGTEINSEINQYGDELPKQTYNTMVDRIWGVYQDDSKYRIAIIKLLEGGLTKGMFEKYLVNIVKYIFNPVTMNNKVRSHNKIKTQNKKKKIYIYIYIIKLFIPFNINGNIIIII